jgi:hypothetical protein
MCNSYFYPYGMLANAENTGFISQISVFQLPKSGFAKRVAHWVIIYSRRFPMITGITILWLVNIGILIWFIIRVGEGQIDSGEGLVGGCLAIVLSIILSIAVSIDLALRHIHGNNWLILGFVVLGVLSVCHFIFGVVTGNDRFDINNNSSGCISIVIIIIGLISSILGIISFYLQYLN